MPIPPDHLSSWRWLVHHRRLLFRESLADTLTTRHELLYASSDAAGLALDEGFGGEVVDAGVEAVGDEVGEHAHELLHLLLFHASLELPLLCGGHCHWVHLEVFGGRVLLEWQKDKLIIVGECLCECWPGGVETKAGGWRCVRPVDGALRLVLLLVLGIVTRNLLASVGGSQLFPDI